MKRKMNKNCIIILLIKILGPFYMKKNINNKCKKDKIITNRDFKVQKDIINDYTAVHMKTDQCSSAGYCWPSGQAD